MEPNKKPYTKWMRATLALTLALLLLAVGLVVVIDPFFHYHNRLAGLQTPLELPDYQNPGIVQNFQYDSIITGSSVSMQFEPSLFGELMGLDMVKVAHNDASPLVLRQTLTLALESNPNLGTAFIGLDHWSLARNPERYSTELPLFLYDQNPFNDVEYALNKEVLFGNAWGAVANTLDGGAFADSDTGYTQGFVYRCGESITLSFYQGHTVPESEAAAPYFDAELAMENTRRNLEENLLPLIDGYPNTRFVVFFPPGSILYWLDAMQYKSLELAIGQLELAITSLLARPNVEVYSFMDVEPIVGNLYHYFDWVHYDPSVHRYMTESFAAGRHQVTADNWQAVLDNTAAMATGFDFDVFFGGGAYAFKNETNMLDYFAQLDPARHTLLVAGQGQAPAASSLVRQSFGAMGLLQGEAGAGYYAAVGGGANAAEQWAAEPTTLEGNVGGGTYVLQGGEAASITIDGLEYAQGLPGYNIVVWDNQLARVVDSVAFDYAAQPYGARRTSPRV